MNESIKKFFNLFFVHFCILAFCAFAFRSYLIFAMPIPDLYSQIGAVFMALLFDFTVAVYTFLPFLLVYLVFPKKYQKIFAVILFFDIFIALFALTSEYLFFQEFHDRFNFIAVDYLVYSNEVIHNIIESYPLPAILTVIFVLSCLLTVVSFRKVKNYFSDFNLFTKIKILMSYAAVVAVLVFVVNERRVLDRSDAQTAVLAKNGYHALFAAYRNNEINYDKFYTTMDSQAAAGLVHDFFKNSKTEDSEKQANFATEDQASIERYIHTSAASKRLNVIVVLMESLSAKYMGLYGSTEGNTTNLDRLAKEGLFFKNIYSTGTRTVRGIEAVVLSMPPTPGQSIVRREGGTGIFNMSSVFREHNYDSKFIYGGNSFFDNMGAFFSGNSFQIVDKSSFTDNQITFSNAWGVCDEDLFNKVILESDESFKKDRPFFSFVLTTSNHRPYTYPQNIDTLSGSGRGGAVKYSDYAIGKLIETAKLKPWFKDTVFVFVSDHNASVAGGDWVRPDEYAIPLIFYSPAHILPKTIEKLGSQIDVAPTLFGILNFSYYSKFFGEDLMTKSPNRAFLGTYQKVGLLEPESLTLLSPNKKNELFSFKENRWVLTDTSRIENVDSDTPDRIRKTVAFYKTASAWFTEKLMDERFRFIKKKDEK